MTKYISCAEINPVQGCEDCPCNCVECKYFKGFEWDEKDPEDIEIVCENPNR